VVHEFITGTPRHADIDRVLAAILFTNLVASTERAAALGDDRWRRVLDAHDATVSSCVNHYRGRVVKSTSDGVLAIFDGPGRAVRCAKELIPQTKSIGLDLRAGLHTGECLQRGDDVGGIGVHIAARVRALAGTGQVLAEMGEIYTAPTLAAGEIRFAEFADAWRPSIRRRSPPGRGARPSELSGELSRAVVSGAAWPLRLGGPERVAPGSAVQRYERTAD
jgi:class 3 adenylate cyclase